MMLNIFPYTYLPSVRQVFGEVSIQIFCPFLIGWCVFHCWVLRIICIFWILVNFQLLIYFYIMLPVCNVSSHSPNSVFHRSQRLNFNKLTSIFSFMPLVLNLKTYHQTKGHPNFLLCYSLRIYSLAFYI